MIKAVYMKRICAAVFITGILMTAVHGFVKVVENQNRYEQFLKNQTKALDEEGNQICLKELFDGQDAIKYLMFDIDGDGTEELHVRSEKFYYVLKNRDGRLLIIHSGTAYEYPLKGENISGVLYHRYGGAPTHEIFYFIEFGGLDQKQVGPVYQWYDENGNGKEDGEDIYLKDQVMQDMEEWKKEVGVFQNGEVIDTGWDFIANGTLV